MLGYYRYLFATMVALSHIWTELMWWQGNYGVFCFYVVSGYLMCFILREVYTGADGSLRYALNRALRIYPLYWAALLIGIFTRLFITSVENEKMTFGIIKLHGLRFPDDLSEWVSNLTLLVPYDKDGLVISQAWSLQVELIFYLLMIFLVRRFWIVVFWFVASIIWVGYLEFAEASFVQRYTSVAGGSIAFSLGAMIYFARQKVKLASWHLPFATALFLAHLWFAPDIWGFERAASDFNRALKPEHFGIYGAAILAGYILWAAMSRDKIDKKGRFERVGKTLGDWSYGIFLIHFVAYVVALKLNIPYENKLIFILFTLGLTNLMAWQLFWWIEHPINRKIRTKIRPVTV